MLNRYTITLCVKYLFDNINKINNENDLIKCLDYISNINSKLPDDIDETTTKLYNDIILNNKNIDFDTQINMVINYFNKLKTYVNDNCINDRNINNRINLMNIEIQIMSKKLKNRNAIGTIKKL